MRKFYISAIALLLSFPAYAQEVPTGTQVRLQNTMQNFLSQMNDDEGGYSYIDPDSASMQTLYPANTHPMVLSFGKDYLVCSDMVDAGGKQHTADFLVRQFGDQYRVVQMLIDERARVEAAMKKR